MTKRLVDLQDERGDVITKINAEARIIVARDGKSARKLITFGLRFANHAENLIIASGIEPMEKIQEDFITIKQGLDTQAESALYASIDERLAIIYSKIPRTAHESQIPYCNTVLFLARLASQRYELGFNHALNIFSDLSYSAGLVAYHLCGDGVKVEEKLRTNIKELEWQFKHLTDIELDSPKPGRRKRLSPLSIPERDTDAGFSL